MKKDKHFSFRCTDDDWDYVVQLADADDRTPSYVLNQMIKKYREQNQKTLLEGVRLIDEAINSTAQIHSVFATEETLNSNQRLVEKIQSHHIPLDMINQDDLNGISDTQHSQGIIAEVKTNSFTLADLSNGLTDHIIVLDNISDPGNLGAIFRTCAWYGVKSVVLTSGTVDPFNFKSMRAAMGSHFYFDHSYHFVCEDEFISAKFMHSLEVVAAVQRENIFGVQFHPEKSQNSGLKLFRCFFNYVKEYNKKRINVGKNNVEK